MIGKENQISSVHDNTFNGKAEFSCQPGYRLKGKTEITCLANGEWSDEVPVCERKLAKSTSDVQTQPHIGKAYELSIERDDNFF